MLCGRVDLETAIAALQGIDYPSLIFAIGHGIIAPRGIA
jgi:hypothetical protein